MQTSLSWLSTHLDLSSYTTAQLSDLLTFAGVEVEGIEERGVTTDKVVVAQIQSFEQHPNADKLSVCQVDDGSGTHARSFAAPRTSKQATKCRSHSLEPFCPADSPSKKANCAASIPWA
jgi:phenylalanyl-tRNA synthetase beta chain